ncbi:PIR Superfamily Protein [Plasmodium ovale curtisi]|uniref:PIR Superfamily Protein n=1 Tax=Plasmodium ovale curtisi TaxID=864141 RepID=A0A1A8XGB5_PLAOA|nr:PIR Superfamily Protein [Plasmodium ovale curtisi]SBT02966.1 PIR Superfamily Protein [Plasmodium ovale curtisi]
MGNDEDPDISILQSEQIYYKLNTASEDYTKDSDAFWNALIANHHLKDLTIFPILAKGSYYVSKMNEYHASYDERWNYLYFWAGLKVLESLETSYFSEILQLFNTVKRYNDKNKSPYSQDMLNMHEEKFENLKKIYEYLENYEGIDLKIRSPNTPCTAAYKEYVTSSHTLYLREKELCNNKYHDEYCRLLNSFIKKNIETFKTQLTCTGRKPIKEPSQEDEQDPGHISASEVQPRVEAPSEGLSHLPRGLQADTPDLEIDPGVVSPSSGSTNAISTVFPLLGTASLAFFFFKFTPLGSRLYNNIFSKQIIRTNVEEAQELLENSYEFSNMNIEENSHHVGYHNM